MEDADDPLEKAVVDPESTVAADLLRLFSGELNPVAPKAQKKVPIPEGLDLDAWINEPPEESDSESDQDIADNLFVKTDRIEYGAAGGGGKERYVPEPTEDEIRRSREARKYEQQNNPHYLKGFDGPERPVGAMMMNNEPITTDNIPVAELDLNISLKVAGQKRSDKYLSLNATGSKKKSSSKKKGKKKRRKSESSSDENVAEGPMVEIKRDLELPEGATLSDSDSSHGHADDPHKALNIDLDLPSVYEEGAKSKVEPPEQTRNDEKKVKKSKKKSTKENKKEDRDRSKSEKKHREKGLGDGDETEQKKKSKKPKKEKKEKKDKERESEGTSKRGKKKKSASGYEEALGISTPSKEFQ